MLFYFIKFYVRRLSDNLTIYYIYSRQMSDYSYLTDRSLTSGGLSDSLSDGKEVI